MEEPPNTQPAVPIRAVTLGVAALVLLPSALYLPTFIRGEIPLSMDTVMYFFPLRWHAAQLVRSGQWPWWNRCILGGTPLFSNPQSALAYPLNWLMFIWPGAFSFTFPMTLQLGLWAGMTALLLWRMGISLWVALWCGALCLAGNYGWSRLQFGNYLNVLPWWPVWMLAAHEFASSGNRKFLSLGGASVALMILAGAHQLALYGGIGLAGFAVWMIAVDAPNRKRWSHFLLVSLGIGILLGALGWLPQWAFVRETARSASLDPRRVLDGTFGSVREAALALTGPWTSGFADAEASASIGVFAFVSAGIIPAERRRFKIWLGLWLVALGSFLLTLRPIVSFLIEVLPSTNFFHDPRRLLGVTQWFVILAAGISMSDWGTVEGESGRYTTLRYVSGVLCFLFSLVLLHPPFWDPQKDRHVRLYLVLAWVGSFHWAAFGLFYREAIQGKGYFSLALVSYPLSRFLMDHDRSADLQDEFQVIRSANALVDKFLMRLMAIVGLAGLCIATWETSDFSRIKARELFPPDGAPPFIVEPHSKNPRRFFSLDWQRASSYDFRRPALMNWSLPNLPMLWGVEDIGGYEPARSSRYDRWLKSACSWPEGRQPWAEHFGLIYPSHPAELNSSISEANLGSAILPIWGVAVYLRQTGPNHWAGVTKIWPGDLDWRVVSLPAKTATAEGQRNLSLALAPQVTVNRTLDDATRTTSSATLLPMDLKGLTVNRTVMQSEELRGASESSSHPARVDLELNPGDQLGGLYLWSRSLSEIYQPLSALGFAMLCRYRGPTQWTVLKPENPAEQDMGQILDTEIRANRLKLNVRWEGNGPAMLEIHDADWSGWKATVDGSSVLIRASGPDQSGLWRQIAIPAPSNSTTSKDHTVDLIYRPPFMRMALLMTMLGGIVIVAILWMGNLKFHEI